MAYQALARKWRPRNFNEVVGQEHVVKALTHALEFDRMHHAYLFTGTRGVGKTTLARILAKAVNCESRQGFNPCGECLICREVDEGRCVDLIEVDAASRTKVEDTRDLLDYTQYAPTRGRYKVYLIDEVHMLSRHSFNALLKTLEEPPPHIKFLLATTDPQRLPVTILSRCLQFNLKRLPAEAIDRHLARVLEQEGIAAEPAAITRIARAAEGSVRDSLSLLDQAIAYGGGRLSDADVREMLGSIDRSHVYDILDAVARSDGAGVLEHVHRASEYTVEFSELLDELISSLQAIAVAHVVPQSLESLAEDDQLRFRTLALAMGREDVQLYYQIAVLGRRDLPYVPDPRAGMEMILLRMLAFRPASVAAAPASRSKPAESMPKSGQRVEPAPVSSAVANRLEGDWESMLARLNLQGMVREMAVNCVLSEYQDKTLRLMLDKAHAHLYSKALEERLLQAMQAQYGPDMRLSIAIGEPAAPTPAVRKKTLDDSRKQEAMAALEDDAGVRALKDLFDARIVPESVQPLEEER
jgi:DNA polymerase-3 subunit gamma/tau